MHHAKYSATRVAKRSLFFSLLVFSLSGFFSSVNATITELDHIAVVVNDDVITEKMINNRVLDFKKQLKLTSLSDVDASSLRKQVVERMIRDQIQLQKSKQFGIQVDDLTLNRMLDQLAASNKMSLDEFRNTIELEGLNYRRFREQTRNELIIKNLQQRLVVSKITISNQEIQQYIEQNETGDNANTIYHLRHILISTPEEASPEALKKAELKSDSVYRKIIAGADFERMAIKESSGRNALKGGDLGKRKANELPQLFVDAIKKLSPGEISKPIRSASGFHILQLVSSSDNSIIVQQTHARHILIIPNDKVSDDQARETLLELKQKLEEDDENFAKLASEFSDDPGSKKTGGDLGWASPGTYVGKFESVMDNLQINQISEPFKTPFGWHLLQVLERRDYNQTQANKEAAARKAIQSRKIDEELRLWLRRIRDEAYVKYLDESQAN